MIPVRSHPRRIKDYSYIAKDYELHEQFSIELFGKHYDSLSKEEQEAVSSLVIQHKALENHLEKLKGG